MIDLAEELRRVTQALNAANVRYALVGGLAVAVHGHARATRDIDLAVAAAELRVAVEALTQLGYRSHSGNVQFAGGKVEMRRLNRFDAGDFVVVDLLVPMDESLKVVLAERLFDEGFQLWIASREGLRTMKRLRSSPQDLADIAALDEGEP